jgi:K+ transporter
MATLAVIIASQALICSAFTIISEAISLDLWPNIQNKYPTEIKRKMYLPPFKKTLLTLYYINKRFSTSDTQILDLDPSLVTLEYVPLKNIHTFEKKD